MVKKKPNLSKFSLLGRQLSNDQLLHINGGYGIVVDCIPVALTSRLSAAPCSPVSLSGQLVRRDCPQISLSGF
jgi:hypothetical protein